MAKRKMMIPEYGTVMLNGIEYYRTRIEDADGKLVALYARTPEELYNKETNALEQINNATFHRKSPTVAEYCEKWLLMQSVHSRRIKDKGCGEKYPPSDLLGRMSERSKSKFDFGVCGRKPGWRTSVLYAV